MRHVASMVAGVLAVGVLPPQPLAGQSAATSLCGRIVLVGCSGPDDGITMRLVPQQGGAGWQLIVPASGRALFGERVEEHFEQRLACVAAPAGTTIGSRVPIDGPGDIRFLEQAAAPLRTSDVAWPCDAGLQMPRLLSNATPPQCTTQAFMQRVEGSVILRGVVDVTGAVTGIRVLQSLEPSQGEECIKSFSQWHFQPGMRGGQPVPVALSVEMAFTLR